MGDAKPRHLILVMVLFAVVGMSSLGFIGLGIEAAALYPAGGAYVCFTIEGLVQVVGAVLNFYANGDSASGSWLLSLGWRRCCCCLATGVTRVLRSRRRPLRLPGEMPV